MKKITTRFNSFYFEFKKFITWKADDWIVFFTIIFTIGFIIYELSQPSTTTMSAGSSSPKSKIEIAISLILLMYTVVNLSKSRDEMFERLFNHFNTRFDEMNEDLNKIREGKFTENYSDTQKNAKNKSKVSKTEEEIILDYMNLCAEEYLWYKKCRIDPEVWKAWEEGMCYYLDHSTFRKVYFGRANENISYYGLFDYITEGKLDAYKIKNIKKL